MLFKQVFLLATLTLGAASITIAGGDGSNLKPKPQEKRYTADNFRQYTKDLIKSYQARNATSYDNFDDQFIILMSRGFPNIQPSLQKSTTPSLDFNNPQSIIKYDQHQEKLAQKMTRESNLASILNPKTEAELDLDEKLSTQRYRKFNAFAKAGYYSYLKKLFREGTNERVNTCVNVDLDRLGLRGMKAALMPYKEVENKIREQLTILFEGMPTNSHSDHNYHIKSSRFQCDVIITVTEAGLDYLNNTPMVVSFVNPQIAEATPPYFTSQ